MSVSDLFKVGQVIHLLCPCHKLFVPPCDVLLRFLIHYQWLWVETICLPWDIPHLFSGFLKCSSHTIFHVDWFFCYFTGWENRVKFMHLFEGAQTVRDRNNRLDDHTLWCPPQFHRRLGNRGILYFVSSSGTQHFHSDPVWGISSRVRWETLLTGQELMGSHTEQILLLHWNE